MSRLDLVSDCERCAAVCCHALSFDASDDFAFGKAADSRCRNLEASDLCAIHDQLHARGFPGCAQFECHGAGPRVTRAFAETGAHARERNEAFRVLRGVHQLIWLLTSALALCPASQARLMLRIVLQVRCLDALAAEPLSIARAPGLAAHERAAHELLRQVGAVLGGRSGWKRTLPVVR
jgi:hypothetical protein